MKENYSPNILFRINKIDFELVENKLTIIHKKCEPVCGYNQKTKDGG